MEFELLIEEAINTVNTKSDKEINDFADNLIKLSNGPDVFDLMKSNLYDQFEQWLIENPDKINNPKFMNITLLHEACLYAKFDFIKLLIKHGADINVKNCTDLTPLHFACSNDNESIVKFLLENNANPNAVTIYGRTPLDHAKLWNKYEKYKNIIENIIENK